jgi:hypothetical protein
LINTDLLGEKAKLLFDEPHFAMAAAMVPNPKGPAQIPPELLPFVAGADRAWIDALNAMRGPGVQPIPYRFPQLQPGQQYEGVTLPHVGGMPSGAFSGVGVNRDTWVSPGAPLQWRPEKQPGLIQQHNVMPFQNTPGGIEIRGGAGPIIIPFLRPGGGFIPAGAGGIVPPVGGNNGGPMPIPQGGNNPLGNIQPPVDPTKRFARGGIVTSPTRGLIGEAGPEAVVPLNFFARMMGVGPAFAAQLCQTVAGITKTNMSMTEMLGNFIEIMVVLVKQVERISNIAEEGTVVVVPVYDEDVDVQPVLPTGPQDPEDRLRQRQLERLGDIATEQAADTADIAENTSEVAENTERANELLVKLTRLMEEIKKALTAPRGPRPTGGDTGRDIDYSQPIWDRYNYPAYSESIIRNDSWNITSDNDD